MLLNLKAVMSEPAINGDPGFVYDGHQRVRERRSRRYAPASKKVLVSRALREPPSVALYAHRKETLHLVAYTREVTREVSELEDL